MRTILLSFLTLLLLIAIHASARAQQPALVGAGSAQVWNQFRHGGGLNDVVVDPDLPRELSWRFNAPAKGTSSSPVVYGRNILIAANDHVLYSLDGTNGTPTWQWKGDNQIMTAPVYRNGIAVVGTGNADSPIWNPGKYNVVGMGASDLDGIDLLTGKRVWSFALTGTGMPMPALYGPTVLHVDGSGVFLALDSRTGAYLWRKLYYSNASMANVLVDGDVAFFAAGFPNAVYALSAIDGHPVWTHSFPTEDGAFTDCPLATDGSQLFGMFAVPMGADAHKLTIVGTHARQHVYALDQRTGALRWDTAISATGAEPPFNESAIPMYANGTVYDGSPLGAFVTALDARTGRVKWTLQVGGPVKSGLVTRDGVLYFGDLSGKLWAVDAAHGNAIGSIQTDLKFNVGSPIILNDSLVIGSQEGPIVALPLAAIAHSESVKGVTSASHHILRDILLVVIAFLVVLAGLRIVAVSRRRPATRR